MVQSVVRDRFTHRGHTIFRHRKRWRFMWRPEDRWIARDTLDAAIAELDRLIDQRRRERSASRTSGLTARDLVEEWWGRKKRELRESTGMRYESVIRVHIDPKIGDLSANDLRPLDVEDYYASVTYKTALVSRDVLGPAFRWGLTNRLVLRPDGLNPFELVRINRARCLGGTYESEFEATQRVEEKLIPSPGEVEKLLVDAEVRGEDRWWLYLRLAVTLGARPGEICALRKCDLNQKEHRINIARSANKLTYKVTSVKRASSIRRLYLGPQFFDDIGPILENLAPEEFLFPATGRRSGSRRIDCWTANGAYGRMRRATKRLDLPPYTPHSLRHFCATHLLDQGWPPMQVARWLGHRNDTMVRLLYAAHIVEETQTQIGEAAARLVPRASHGRG
ncbi:MAG: tyrosine-type recombinase/integrase [Actinomycetota bacterium]|nr:site-specific integrase [Actinomycetota bacterium]